MNRREAEELLPWFVAGTLSDEETRAVQAFIDSGEIAATDVDELALFAETVSEKAEDEPDYNQQIQRNVMAQLDDVPQEAPEEPVIVRETTAAESNGLLARISEAISWQQTPTFSKLAMGAQFAAVLALALVVAMPGEDIADTTYATVSGTAVAANADLSVAFADGVTEADLRALLLDSDARIVDGPNSLGMYGVALPEGADVAAMQQTLQASPLTAFVQPAPRP